jgi:hypothetical protein
MQNFVQFFSEHGLFGLLAVGQLVFAGYFIWGIYKEDREQRPPFERRRQESAHDSSGRGTVSEPSNATSTAGEWR